MCGFGLYWSPIGHVFIWACSLRNSNDLLHLVRLVSSDARRFRIVLKASSVLGRFGAGWDAGISSRPAKSLDGFGDLIGLMAGA